MSLGMSGGNCSVCPPYKFDVRRKLMWSGSLWFVPGVTCMTFAKSQPLDSCNTKCFIGSLVSGERSAIGDRQDFPQAKADVCLLILSTAQEEDGIRTASDESIKR